MIMKNRETLEQAPNHLLIQKSPLYKPFYLTLVRSQSYKIGDSKFEHAYSPHQRDMSPLTRLMKMNDGQQFPQHYQKDYVRNEREGSWDSKKILS